MSQRNQANHLENLQRKPKPQSVQRQEAPASHQAEAATPALRGNSIDDQAAMLQRLPAAQQQATIAQLGRTQSNRHVQRLVTAMRKASDTGAAEVSPDVENNIQKMEGGGKPLAQEDQQFFGSRMGADFSNVRIHTDSNAAQTSEQINARAFTHGNNIAFRSPSEYQPGTQSGRELLAHELTHVVQQTGAVQAKSLQRKEGDGERQPGAEGQISTQDVQYEVIAHRFGYQDSIPAEGGALLERWGYQPNWSSKINDGATGLFVGLIMPANPESGLTPILVFRGTEPTTMGDIMADMHPTAVGRNQFAANREVIAQMIAEAGGRVDITGHSLGGALAQHAASEFAGNCRRVVTFQAPGINFNQAEKFNGMDESERPQATHHIAGGDIVDTAGRRHLDGDFFRHTPGGGPLSHLKYLLTSPELQSQRDELGLDDETLKGLGIEMESNSKPIEHSTKYPHNIKRFFAEVGRTVVGGFALYPLLATIKAVTRSDDKDIREDVSATGPEELATRPASERAYMIRRLCKGITGNADEATILDVLQASAMAGDAVTVIDVADPWLMAKAMHGKQYQELKAFFQEHYYAQASQDMALSLIQHCMDGMTPEWQQEMIADILVARADNDGREIITRIGQIYKRGGFKEGLNKLQWQLDGQDQRRVDAIYEE